MTVRLSKRQLEVLIGISYGSTDREIGLWLDSAKDTIKTQVHRLFVKLRVSSRAHAVRRGFELGLLHEDDLVDPDVVVAVVETSLTQREMRVLTAISFGKTNAEIGGQLGLSEDTVKTHVGRMFAKLDVTVRAHAVRRGFEEGLLDIESSPDPEVARARRCRQPRNRDGVGGHPDAVPNELPVDAAGQSAAAFADRQPQAGP